MKPYKCSTCHRKFNTRHGTEMHITAKHQKKGGEPIKVDRAYHDESIADQIINAELDRAMGLPVDDYLLDMME